MSTSMIELVWDTEQAGTAIAPSGASAIIGEGAPFSPEDLLAMAAAGCLMRSLLALATKAGVTLMSYAATAQVGAHDATGEPQIVVHGYVVASSGCDEHLVHQLCRASVQRSPMARLLGPRLTSTWDIRVLSAPAPTVH